MNPLNTAIAIRAYSEKPGREPLGARPFGKVHTASSWSLVFDCETTIDATQQLRIGFYQVRKGDVLKEEGVFYDRNSITHAEFELIKSYARSRNLKAMTVAAFRTDVFLKYGYIRCGTVVGFNLPFDLSRIAMRHGPAMRHMRGGFSFQLTRDSDDPRVRVKHLSPRAALIDFAKPGDQETPRGMRNRDLYVPAFRGHFVDVKTLAAAILSRRFTLQSLAAFLGTTTQKLDTDEHGTITTDYLDYARTDVQTTWECFAELERRYAAHGLDNAVYKLLSEASVGKAYLQQMGVTPFLRCAPKFPRELFGQIFCPYYGGRAEVRNRRMIHEVLYCDFKSMYPTVNSLMGLWEFVIADGMTWHDSTTATREFLHTVTIDDLQRPETWRQLRTLVQLKPDDDVLPVRAKYDGQSHTIGLNYLTTAEPLWFTLADCIVSKLMTGKTPNIEKATTFEPGPPQQGLQAVDILRREDYRINLAEDDFFTRLIDLRDEAKANDDDSIQKTLKIIANSTSYGIFIEVNRDNAPKSELLNVYGPDGKCIPTNTKAFEEPGRYFNPLLGVLITGAARLMLGIAEKNTIDSGLDWAFCDTDSLAIIKPQETARRVFHKKAKDVIDWFIPLTRIRHRYASWSRNEPDLVKSSALMIISSCRHGLRAPIAA